MTGDINRQRNFLNEVLPSAKDIDYLLNRIVDGTGRHLPRELTRVFARMIDVQRQWHEKGFPSPTGKALFIKECNDDALAQVSADRLRQTIYAEYPHLKPWIEKPAGGKAEHSSATLASVWAVADATEAARLASDLVAIGVLNSQPSSEEFAYLIPFPYRPAVNVSAGRSTRPAPRKGNAAGPSQAAVR